MSLMLTKVAFTWSNTVKYSKTNVVNYYNLKYLFSILIYFKMIYSGDIKAEFSAVITTVISVTWFFRNQSIMQFIINFERIFIFVFYIYKHYLNST